jgi:hypothetical protein
MPSPVEDSTMTAQAFDVTEAGAIVHGLAEAGSFAAIERGVVAELRDALPALGAALAARTARRLVASPEWRTALALDILARLDRPLVEVDAETLQEAMNDATTAAVYALAEDALEAAGGA